MASKAKVNRAGDRLRHWWLIDGAEDVAYPVEAVQTMLAFRAGFQDPLTKVVMSLRSFQTTEGVKVDVAQRLKRGQTIIDKLGRIPGMELARMHDIGGCRAIVPEGRFDVLDGIRKRLDGSVNVVVRPYDYIMDPKPTGYRAVHVVVHRDGHLIEIQLRTARQHAWAEFVEQLGDRTGNNLKDGQGPEVLLEYLRMGASIVAMQERQEPVPDLSWGKWRELTAAVAPYLAGSREE
jgi:ppGpp synthetase/RelA/SpoT-type nucleotidyltranferase